MMQDNLVKRLPTIIAFSMGILVGTLCHINGLENNDIYFRTAVAIVLSYLVGIMVKKTIISLDLINAWNAAQKIEKGGNIDVTVGDEQDDQPI